MSTLATIHASIATMELDEALAIARLRQWAAQRIANMSGKVVKYQRDGWTKRNDRSYDAAYIRVIDFERALNMLDDEQKIVLVLRYRDRQVDPDIAAALGCSVRKVSYLIPEARRNLAAVLDRLNLL